MRGWTEKDRRIDNFKETEYITKENKQTKLWPNLTQELYTADRNKWKNFTL